METVDSNSFEAEFEKIRKLETRLRMAFEDAPVEDGFCHSAESIIDETLLLADQKNALRVLGSLATDDGQPVLAASVLRCLGRRSPGTPAWRAGVVRTALSLDDVEIRDAAVQAAESWGGAEIREILRGHTEEVPWLCTYIHDVVEDLGE